MDGGVIIDKPAGMTSHDVVARVRRITGQRRTGHTGTLDPFATGVLVTLLGRATRLAQFLSGAEKEYEAVIRLGYATDTGDLTGNPLPPGETKARRDWSEMEIEEAARSLQGESMQMPPMYSAKKVSGKKLYEHARRGETIERKAVPINVACFEPLRQNEKLLHIRGDKTADLVARITCSAGTYVRVLAETLGEKLGTGAHLAALRRTRAGEFRIEQSVTLPELKEMAEAGNISDRIISPSAVLSLLPFVHLSGEEVRKTGHGMEVDAKDLIEGINNNQHVRMQDESGMLIAVGVYDAERKVLHPRVCFAP